MPRRILSSVSSKVLLVLIIFLALEYFPFTGIYLWFVGGPLIAGVIVHLLFLSVFLEGATGRIPRLFVLVPIVAYGGYYAAYFWESSQVAQMSKTLRATNPGKLNDFDPAANSLVMDQALTFVETRGSSFGNAPRAQRL